MSNYDETLKMTKYIVPVKNRVLEWKSFFEECFKDEEALNEAMNVFATMMTTFLMESHLGKAKINPFVLMLERCHELAEQYQVSGQLPEEHTEELAQHAYEFVTGLTAFLKDVGVLKSPSTIKFEGFVGMDIAISVDHIDDQALGEDLCQSG